MLFLEVDYDTKDEVKKLGAKWNPDVKKWYIEKQEDYNNFAHYILRDFENATIVKNYIYLVVTQQNCWKCKKKTNVIGFCIPERIEFYNTPLIEWQNGKFDTESEDYNFKKFFFSKEKFDIEDIFSYEILNLGNFSEKLLKLIQKEYNYKLKYSKSIGSSYYANCCEYCNALQGDNFLFDDKLSSPFYVTNKDMAKNLKFIKYNIKNDFLLYGYNPSMVIIAGYTVEDQIYNIETYSTFINSNIEIDDII